MWYVYTVIHYAAALHNRDSVIHQSQRTRAGSLSQSQRSSGETSGNFITKIGYFDYIYSLIVMSSDEINSLYLFTAALKHLQAYNYEPLAFNVCSVKTAARRVSARQQCVHEGP